MYRMAVMTMFAPPSLAAKLNIPHCTKMALIHDVAESIVGDITPMDREVPKTEKARREAAVMAYIADSLLPGVYGGITAQDIKAVFEEYEANESLEAKFVHDVDKVELLLQAVEYERANEGKIVLTEFYGTLERIVLPEIRAWGEGVIKEREAFWADKGGLPS
jgi:putative hydrolase of HD superfamily